MNLDDDESLGTIAPLIRQGEGLVHQIAPQMPGTAAPLAPGASPFVRAYHGTPSEIDTFTEQPSYMMDRQLGPHFAADPNVASKFAEGLYRKTYDWAGRETPPPGGKVYPINITGKFKPVPQPPYNWRTEDMAQHEGILTDQTAVENEIAHLGYLARPDLLGRYLIEARRMSPEDAMEAANKLTSGQQATLEGKPYDLEGFIRNWGGKPYNETDRGILIGAARDALAKQGYHGLSYINTSGNEVSAGMNPMTYIPTTRNTVKNAITGDTMYNKGGRQKLKKRAFGGQTYTIQKGDTLGDLAHRFGTTISALVKANDIDNPNRIRAGASLSIPMLGKTTTKGDDLPSSKIILPPPPKPKPAPTALDVMWQSEYNKNPKSGVIVLPDPPPPPPPPTIKADEMPSHPNSDQFPLAVEGGNTSLLQRAHEAIDPVSVLGNTTDPGPADYLSTALAGLGAFPEAEAARLEQPMAGAARDIGDNTVTNTPPRSLISPRFVKMNPRAMGQTPLRGEPVMGRGPRSPISVDPVTGKFRAGRSLEVPADQSSMGIDSPFMRRDPITDPEPMSIVGEPQFNRGGYAMGGNPSQFVEKAASYGLRHEGFLNSGVAGRTDHIGLQVRNGSYVIPADVVSAAGQGNSLAGAKAFDALLKQGPYGTHMGTGIRSLHPTMPKMPSMSMPRAPMGGMGGMSRSTSTNKTKLNMSGIPGFKASGGNVSDSPPKNTTDVPKNVPPKNDPWGANARRNSPQQVASGGTISPLSPEAMREQFIRDLMDHMHSSNIPPSVARGVSPDDRFWMIRQQQRWLNGQDFEEYARGGAPKKPRELVAPKEGNYSAGGVSHPTSGPGHKIPILAAGGEYLVSPETVTRLGNGDQQKGFRILDKLVLLTRKKHIKTLRNLKPPKKK